MLISVKNTAILSKLSKEELEKIKAHLTISNPLFSRKLDLGLAIFGVPSQLTYYNQIDEETLEIPVGAVSSIITFSSKILTKGALIDNRTVGLKTDYFNDLEFTGTLRNYQTHMVNAALDKTVGVIQAKTGSGKTIAFVKLTLDRKVPTLILVNTIELANQTIDKFVKFTSLEKEDIGFIGNGKFDVKPISVGLHQTLNKLDDSKYQILNDTFGQIIADEVHIVAASTYYENMNKLNAKYKFGFSATPFRTDGLTQVIHFATGPLIHQVPIDDLGFLIQPDHIKIDTNYFFPLLNSSEYQMMINDLSQDAERNQLIVDTLKDYPDNYICLLCQRVRQAEILKEMIPDSLILVSQSKKYKVNKKQREEIIRQIMDKEKRIIISTFPLFSTGIDIPHLDVLFLCAPTKNRIVLTQAAGRLMRPADGKESATIVDFVDKRIDMLKGHYYARKKILKDGKKN